MIRRQTRVIDRRYLGWLPLILLTVCRICRSIIVIVCGLTASQAFANGPVKEVGRASDNIGGHYISSTLELAALDL